MTQYQGYLLDLDGTMYRGDEVLPGGADLVRRLVEAGIPYRFITNNSSKTPEEAADKLTQMGIAAAADHVITSSMAAADYLLRRHGTVRVFAVGERGLFHALTRAGHQLTEDRPDVVVIGIDREITYEKLAAACLFIRDGAAFIVTNADKAIPTERGLMPGNGALAAAVETSTGQAPVVIGKPEEPLTTTAMASLNLPKEQVVLVGDNYDTDISAGFAAGIDTLMVLTGLTSREELTQKQQQPDYVVDDLTEWEVVT
ncbi:TIGR01457 family HAD-type hydrolase [Alkalicoccus chagannorensis]|uniref:TIGR01457 family HAD-type hydrolase n=1 Tax=Alkalicoccus chagannorensis TaxID=427072 RepID=UPI000423D3B5|nr:TIGR01457 family HAD-type hydrolase [Alkalicoccus chagannorensis]